MTTTHESRPVEGRGFVLLEALIALVIFAVGLLAIAAFQGNLIKTSAESRAYTEAMHIAQGKLDELRSLAWDSLTEEVGGTERRLGSNETFMVAWTVSPDSDPEQGLPYRLVEVTVETEDSAARRDVEYEPIRITLKTFVARVSDSQLVEAPGDAQRGIGPPEGLDPDRVEDRVEDRSDGFEFGTAEGDRFVIIPETGQFLRAPPPDGNGGGGFARVSGNLLFYKESALTNPDPVDDSVRPRLQVVATGNSLCRVFPEEPIEIGGDYEVLGYTCFVGSNWLGRVLVAPAAGLQVCLGSPDARPLAFTSGTGRVAERRYFGIEFNAEDQPIEIGIRGGAVGTDSGAEASFGSICTDAQDYCWETASQDLVPGGHHFLIKGFDDGKSCADAMMAFPAEFVENSVEAFNEPYGTNDWNLNPNNLFYDNPAGLVCTTRPTCGAVTGTRTTFRTRMSGFLNAGNDLEISDVRLSGQSLNCQVFGQLDGAEGDGDGSGIYWCPLRDPLTTVISGVVRHMSDSEAGTDDPPAWYYRIERDEDRKLVADGKRAGESVDALDRLAFYDFTGFDFALIRRAVDTEPGGEPGGGDNGGSEDGDEGTGNGGDDEDGANGGTACEITVAGNRRNRNQIIEVSLPTTGGACTFPSNSEYRCVIVSTLPVTVELTARGPGSSLDEHTIQVTECGSTPLGHNFP